MSDEIPIDTTDSSTQPPLPPIASDPDPETPTEPEPQLETSIPPPDSPPAPTPDPDPDLALVSRLPTLPISLLPRAVETIANLARDPDNRTKLTSAVSIIFGFLRIPIRAQSESPGVVVGVWKHSFRALGNLCADNVENCFVVLEQLLSLGGEECEDEVETETGGGGVKVFGETEGPVKRILLLAASDSVSGSDFDIDELRFCLHFLTNLVHSSVKKLVPLRLSLVRYGILECLLKLLDRRLEVSQQSVNMMTGVSNSLGGRYDQIVDPNAIISQILQILANLLRTTEIVPSFLRLQGFRYVMSLLESTCQFSSVCFEKMMDLLLVLRLGLSEDQRVDVLTKLDRLFIQEKAQDASQLELGLGSAVPVCAQMEFPLFEGLMRAVFMLDYPQESADDGVDDQPAVFLNLFRLGIIARLLCLLVEKEGADGTASLSEKKRLLLLKYVAPICLKKELRPALFDAGIVDRLKLLVADEAMHRMIVLVLGNLAMGNLSGEFLEWCSDEHILEFLKVLVDKENDFDLRKNVCTLLGNLSRHSEIACGFVSAGLHHNMAKLIEAQLECMRAKAERGDDEETTDEGGIAGIGPGGLYEYFMLDAQFQLRAAFAFCSIVKNAAKEHLPILFDQDHLNQLMIRMLCVDSAQYAFYVTRAMLEMTEQMPMLRRTWIPEAYDGLLRVLGTTFELQVRASVLRLLHANFEWDEEVKMRFLKDEEAVDVLTRIVEEEDPPDPRFVVFCEQILVEVEAFREDRKET